MPVDAIEGQLYLEYTRRLTEDLLDKYLPSDTVPPQRLHAAMRYSVMAGGKRLRPALAFAVYKYCNGDVVNNIEIIHLAMAALEMVHTYSLIHDDLPCMDDDDLRRGRPTCHKQFDEAVAVLAGDALHVVAFELMAKTGSIRAVMELAEAIGTSGMLGGQMADVEAEGQAVTRDEIVSIHKRKTGALIRGAVRIGAILAGASEALLSRLTEYGEKIGLAFQIIDDILDIEGDQKLLGKKIGSDSKNQKATYPGTVGLEMARRDAARLIDEALAVINNNKEEDNLLKYLARFIGQREK
ncbi:MAG: polyprenyl synthetase family protein [candidate division Zixibacteria bacterium]|nr:polyprenyl synthetase family protein [candidate division Zixibacteria bacterium]